MCFFLILSPHLLQVFFPFTLLFLIAILLVTHRGTIFVFLYIYSQPQQSVISRLCFVHSSVCLSLRSVVYCCLTSSRVLFSWDLRLFPLPLPLLLASRTLCLLLSLLSKQTSSFCTPQPSAHPQHTLHLFVSFKGLGHVHAFCPPQSPQWRASEGC